MFFSDGNRYSFRIGGNLVLPSGETSRPFPVFPLVGPKTLTDLKEILGNTGANLAEDDLRYLEYGETVH